MTSELKARQEIDRLLGAAGWHVCDMAQANIHAARGVAVREFPLASGHGFADYLRSDEREHIIAEVDRRLSLVSTVEAEIDANLKRSQSLRQSVLQRAFSAS